MHEKNHKGGRVDTLVLGEGSTENFLWFLGLRIFKLRTGKTFYQRKYTGWSKSKKNIQKIEEN